MLSESGDDMYTRIERLENKCTHREYFAQFVNTNVLSLVENTFGRAHLKRAIATDEHLNNIPLSKWDSLVPRLGTYIANQLQMVGDWLTLGSGVCILKEAAKQITEKEN
jgi:hypothetical protein